MNGEERPAEKAGDVLADDVLADDVVYVSDGGELFGVVLGVAVTITGMVFDVFSVCADYDVGRWCAATD